MTTDFFNSVYVLEGDKEFGKGKKTRIRRTWSAEG